MACKMTSSPTTSSNTMPIAEDQSSYSLVSVSSQDESFKCREHADHVLKRMKTYLATEQLCDVTLISALDGKRVSAHRLVLAASSSYFDAMFTGSLREANENEITIQEVPGDTLQILVNYCYTGMLEIREDTVETLLATSCLLQLNSVINACSTFLVKQLHPSNCLGFALFAEQQSCDKLLSLASSYTHMNFMQVWKNQEFFQLDHIQLANLLKSDDLNVPTEAEVFHALMAWVQHEPDTRKKYLAELLALVRLPLLQPAFIADHVEALCNDDAECQQLVMEAMKWHLLPERRSQITTQRTRPRKSTIGKLLTIGGMDMHKGAISIESYDPRSDKWTLLKNMSTKRLQFGVVVMDDKLILVGGRDGLKTLNTVESVDLPTMITASMAQMGTPRHGLGVAVLEGPLYAVGGHDGWSYLSTVERWDPVGRSWSYVCPMSVSRSTAGVAVLANRLYVCGGRDGSSCHRSVESYDPHTNKWTLRAQMNRRRGGVGVAVLNGYMYALGGHDHPVNNPTVSRTETVERYCPQTDTWTMIASLSIGRDSIGVCILGDRLAAVGGYDGNQYLKIFEEYDPESNEWQELAPVNYSRAGACVLNLPPIFLPSNSATVQ